MNGTTMEFCPGLSASGLRALSLEFWPWSACSIFSSQLSMPLQLGTSSCYYGNTSMVRGSSRPRPARQREVEASCDYLGSLVLANWSNHHVSYLPASGDICPGD